MSWWSKDQILEPEDGERTLQGDLALVLNYWSMDVDLQTPDYLLATYLIRHMTVLRMMQDERKKHEGG